MANANEFVITERRCEMCKTYCPCADCEMILDNGEKIDKFPLCQGCIEEMRETYKDVINTKPKKGVIAMACGGKKSGGKKPPKKK